MRSQELVQFAKYDVSRFQSPASDLGAHASLGLLGPRAIRALSLPFFGWEGSPSKIDYRKKITLTLTSSLGTNLFEPLKTGGPRLSSNPNNVRNVWLTLGKPYTRLVLWVFVLFSQSAHMYICRRHR